MLSVYDGRSRARSKSRERSRTRDDQAPSPAARGPPPSSRRKQVYESDSEAVSDGDSDDARYDRRRRDDRERDRYESYRDDDRRRTTYEDDRDPNRRRKDHDNDDDRRTYIKPSKQEYSHPESSRQGSFGREKDKYELPGTYKDYDDRETQIRGGDRYSVSSPTEVSNRIQSGSNSGRSGMYAQPAKYEYAKAPAEVRYLSKGESFSQSSERGPSYTAKPTAEIEIERRRHKREQEEEELLKKYEEAQLQRKKEELERAELIKKYEKELELSKRKDEDQRRLKHKEESSDDDDDEYEYRRLKHANEEHEREHAIERELIRKGTLPSKKYAEIEPDDRRAPQSKLVSGSEHRVVEIRPRENSTSLKPLESGVRRLSVSGGAGGSTLMAPGGHRGPIGGGLPPGSPLLEAYRGTYQSISPMPSPMALPSSMDDGLSDLEPLDGDEPLIIRPRKAGVKKHVVIYDPEHDARTLGNELKHSKPSAGPLIKVLPPLSDDNILALRTDYKKHFKSQGKGINVAKHIKVKFTGNIGKITYATALGRWESEAYWANCWYQAGSSRRELLIESLLGRPNSEIRKIKGAFSDKRYNDSLEKCMQTELKKDKFRHAVLLALEEKRMDEITPISRTLVKADVDALYKALTSREGGETAMIDIIVVRSDNHLREVLKEYEVKYRANFARQMITKSQNLVVRSYLSKDNMA